MKISVKVKPNSKEQTVVKNEDGSWQIRLKSPPVDGKANRELIDIIAKEFQVKKSQIQIKSGSSSKHKLLEISGID